MYIGEGKEGLLKITNIIKHNIMSTLYRHNERWRIEVNTILRQYLGPWSNNEDVISE